MKADIDLYHWVDKAVPCTSILGSYMWAMGITFSPGRQRTGTTMPDLQGLPPLARIMREILLALEYGTPAFDTTYEKHRNKVCADAEPITWLIQKELR